MSNGAIIGIGAGVVVIGGVLFFVLHNQNQAAVAAANAEAARAAAAANGARGSSMSLGDALASLGGRALAAGASYLFGGAGNFALARDKAEQVAV